MACHFVLRENIGRYDYYCYLEDDIVIRDPSFLAKMQWFSGWAGEEAVLQPNRYEASPTSPVPKMYVDGDMAEKVTAPFQDVRVSPELRAEFLGSPVIFRRTLNPHAGCFFLSGGQMARWAGQPGFGVPDARFIGPLESAATLGVMRTFRVYKPGLENAGFLEVEHFDTGYLGQLGRTISVPGASSEQGTGEKDRGGQAAPANVHVGSPAGPHVLFVHPNFPAQFGHVASYLARKKGFRCTFVSQTPPGRVGRIEKIRYCLQGGATAKNNYCSRTFENAIWHTHAVYHALKTRPKIEPDLVVGHSGFASTLFLRELYDCPIINYFEYFYRTTGSDMDFRPDFPSMELNRIRARARNAMLLLDLENCDKGYSPTHWQRDRLPRLFHEKVQVIFDGIDTRIWRPLPDTPRKIGTRTVPDDLRIVTYVSRGMESMRGFDIFMKTAKRLCDRRKDVLFVVVGEDRCCYSGDEQVTGQKSFKEWVLAQDEYDLSRFAFLGRVPPTELARLLSLSDLHVYLTVPFILSWSLMNALACGATVLASRTGPVCEVIEHGKNGLLADFFDVDGLADLASAVLDAPGDFKHLGANGVEMIRSRYSLEVCIPQMLELYLSTIQGRQPSPSVK